MNNNYETKTTRSLSVPPAFILIACFHIRRRRRRKSLVHVLVRSLLAYLLLVPCLGSDCDACGCLFPKLARRCCNNMPWLDIGRLYRLEVPSTVLRTVHLPPVRSPIDGTSEGHWGSPLLPLGGPRIREYENPRSLSMIQGPFALGSCCTAGLVARVP